LENSLQIGITGAKPWLGARDVLVPKSKLVPYDRHVLVLSPAPTMFILGALARAEAAKSMGNPNLRLVRPRAISAQ
jgi:hypothetical protein